MSNTKMKAIHRGTGDKVTFTKTKDFLANNMVKVKFKNGEITTMSEKRFKELFKEV